MIVVFFFVYTMLVFVPPGQLVARLMTGLPPLGAYTANVVGSLVGTWAFAAISYLRFPPWLWFGAGLVLSLWFLRNRWRALAVGFGASIAIVALLVVAQGDTLWSPYYRVDIAPLNLNGQPVSRPDEMGYSLSVNQLEHMEAVNLSPVFLDAHPEYAAQVQPYYIIYNLPYALVQPKRVLIIGAGMGNDAAAALRHGASHVDAVEIDPLIYDLGVEKHPERPYSSPLVKVTIDDARAYLERTDARYDLVVFGILDSQTLLSGMSGVRLDNFVYTVESLQKAREHLDRDGTIVLTFFVERWWIKQRLAQTLLEVFGEPPTQLAVTGTPWTMYIGGYAAKSSQWTALCEQMGCMSEPTLTFDKVPLATDDWPYLYLQRRGIPLTYWVVLIAVVAIAWISTRKAFPEAHGIDWHFFFLGGAFLLIEFKSVTELALLFGSTWIVNVLAVSAVLIMVLLANLVVARLHQVNATVLYALLFAALLAGMAIPSDALLAHGSAVRVVAAVLVMGAPLFFASAIFATSLTQVHDVAPAFASNFLGSAVGGVLEYASLAFGIGILYLLGAALYVASWVAGRRA
jgi:hypothetical protein